MVRKLKRLSNTTEEIRENKSEPAKSVAKSVNVVVKFIVSTGNDDRDRTYEDFIEAVRIALKAMGANHVTSAGGYYILDGKVCLPEDYDIETQNRKPGTHPPIWAMTETDRKEWELLDRINKQKNYDKLTRQPPNLRTASETPKVGTFSRTVKGAPKRASGYDWDSRTKRASDLASVAPMTSVEEVPELEWDESDIDDLETVDDVTTTATHQLRSVHKPRVATRVKRKR